MSSDPADADPPPGPDPVRDLPQTPPPDGLELARALARSVAQARPATGGTSGRGGKGTAGAKRPRRKPVGRTGQVSGSHPDERDPQTLDLTLGRLVADHGWEVDLRVQGIFGRWAELVGQDVARHCHPESFAQAQGGGSLIVRTDSTAWATQMRLLSPMVVRRLNQELGHGTVATIEVRGPQAPSWKRGQRSVRDGRGPRDTYG